MGLLERFAQGELEAFETLFRQFQGEVFGWIIRIVRDPGIAEDLTVETFWRIHRARSRFDPARSFGAWARRIATNTALDYLKTIKPEELLTENQAQVTLPNPAVQRDIRDRIEQAFNELPVYLLPCLEAHRRLLQPTFGSWVSERYLCLLLQHLVQRRWIVQQDPLHNRQRKAPIF
jgi:RNA polymerase sigma factor (sigma-70 family)